MNTDKMDPSVFLWEFFPTFIVDRCLCVTPLKKLLTTTPNAWGQADTKYTKVKTFISNHVVSVVSFVVKILFSVDSCVVKKEVFKQSLKANPKLLPSTLAESWLPGARFTRQAKI